MRRISVYKALTAASKVKTPFRATKPKGQTRNGSPRYVKEISIHKWSKA
jgi:hypothetical protein